MTVFRTHSEPRRSQDFTKDGLVCAPSVPRMPSFLPTTNRLLHAEYFGTKTCLLEGGGGVNYWEKN